MGIPVLIRRIFQGSISHMDFWSEIADRVTVAGVAADLDFPSVTVITLPAGVKIIRVIAMLKVRAIRDTSAADNFIDQAGKTLRVMNATGTWGTNDIVAIDFDINEWYVIANQKESGDVVLGDNNLSAVVTGNGTFDFRSEETNRGDAISALANNLEIYDVQTGLRIYFGV